MATLVVGGSISSIALRDLVVRLVIESDSVLRWSFHSQGRRVLHGPRILILSYDGGHRRVSAILFCLPFDLVSRMVAEG